MTLTIVFNDGTMTVLPDAAKVRVNKDYVTFVSNQVEQRRDLREVTYVEVTDPSADQTVTGAQD
jgi:hypothetical protein